MNETIKQKNIKLLKEIHEKSSRPKTPDYKVLGSPKKHTTKSSHE